MSLRNVEEHFQGAVRTLQRALPSFVDEIMKVWLQLKLEAAQMQAAKSAASLGTGGTLTKPRGPAMVDEKVGDEVLNSWQSKLGDEYNFNKDMKNAQAKGAAPQQDGNKPEPEEGSPKPQL